MHNNPFQMIDTHCHLSSPQLRDQLDELVQNAKDQGVSAIVNIAYDCETIELVQQQCALYPQFLYGAIAIQPHDALEYSPEVLTKVEKCIEINKQIVAVGEIGLEGFHKDAPPMDRQVECFEAFLDLATRTNKPVIIHVRETHDLVLNCVRKYSHKGLKGIIHCFTGTWEEGKDFLDCGLYLSYSGIVTFKNGAELLQTAAKTPLDRILIETDSPYLAPIPYRGKKNQPAYVIETCKKIAQERNMTMEDFARQATSNSRSCFNI